jgi:hypothetical protein
MRQPIEGAITKFEDKRGIFLSAMSEEKYRYCQAEDRHPSIEFEAQ